MQEHTSECVAGGVSRSSLFCLLCLRIRMLANMKYNNSSSCSQRLWILFYWALYYLKYVLLWHLNFSSVLMILFHVFSLRFVGSSLRIKVLIYHCEKNYTCIRNQFLSADVTAPYLNHTFRPLTNQQLVNQSVPRTHTLTHTHKEHSGAPMVTSRKQNGCFW